MRGHVLDDFAAQNSTSGGSSDTDENEFAARPTGSPSLIAVMMVTPVAKCPSTARKAEASGAMGAMESLINGGERWAQASGSVRRDRQRAPPTRRSLRGHRRGPRGRAWR